MQCRLATWESTTSALAAGRSPCTSGRWRASLNKLPEDSRIWKKGGEKPMSAYEYYDHDKLKAGAK